MGAAAPGALLPWRLAGRAEDDILAMVTLHYFIDISRVCNGRRVARSGASRRGLRRGVEEQEGAHGDESALLMLLILI